jgi:hypothetical protein
MPTNGFGMQTALECTWYSPTFSLRNFHRLSRLRLDLQGPPLFRYWQFEGQNHSCRCGALLWLLPSSSGEVNAKLGTFVTHKNMH